MNSEQQVRQVVEELAAAWNRGDGVAFSGLFFEHADYVSGAGIHLKGRRQIQDALFPREAAAMASDQVSLAVQSVTALGPDAAVVLCKWKMNPPDPRKHPEPGNRSGFVTLVMQSAAGVWRILLLQNTDTTP